MRQFKFVGDQLDADGYGFNNGEKPEVGKEYNEDVLFCGCTVLEWSKDTFLGIWKEWEEVLNQESK